MNLHPELKKLIETAQRSEGYFITVTRLSDNRLFTDWFTARFPRGDIYPALEQAKKMVKDEIENYSKKSSGGDKL